MDVVRSTLEGTFLSVLPEQWEREASRAARARANELPKAEIGQASSPYDAIQRAIAALLSSTLCRLLLVFTASLITTVALADAAPCPGVRCTPLNTSPWVFVPQNPGNIHYPSFEAAMTDVQARLSQANDCPVVLNGLNNELPALLALPMQDGVIETTGANWYSINQVDGTKYDIRWASTGTWSTSASSGPYCIDSQNQPLGDMVVMRSYSCPVGWGFYKDGCFLPSTTTPQPDKSRKPGCKCDASGKPATRPSTTDPVDIAEGFMWETATDIDSTRGPTLQRNYNSTANVQYNAQGWPAEGFGYGWRTNYSRHVHYSANDTTAGAYVERPNGQIVYFGQNSSTGTWSTDPDVHSTLIELTASDGTLTGWTYFDEDSGDTEIYNYYGNLSQIIKIGGRALTLAYDGFNNLTSVTDDWGRSLVFAYPLSNGVPTGEVQSVTDSAGRVWSYSYDPSYHTLTQMTSPDGSTVVYHFENTSTPTLVTGEGYVPAGGTESRYSWFTYDANQRATQAYNAGNANQTTLTYGSGSTVVTSQISASVTSTRTYNFNIAQGMSKLSTVTGDCDSQCGPKSAVVDANGNVNSTTDFNGVVTNYTYSADGAGLEIQRVEAAGTSTQRTIQTDWNEGLRLPTERRTFDAAHNLVAKQDWSYNAAGEVLARCEADPSVAGATGYTCGSASNAPTGVRQWRYAYCTAVDTVQCPLVGLLLTATGPRTDLAQTAAYSYYMASSAVNCGTPGAACYQAGDVKSVTDALGHVTTIVSYDADGRATRVTDANGVSTDSTYNTRGWLTSRTVSGATTNITYTPYGAVASITDPDNVTVTFGYDGAHRLTTVTDALGNYVQYTLDGAGNKTAEQIFDSTGALHKSLSRTYNTLGQLTQVTDGLSHAVFNAAYTDSYDANGNRVHTADALGVQRKQGYDGLNRLVSTIDNYNGTDTATQNTQSVFAYDANDRLEGVSDPDGLTTTYSYDGLGNATGVLSPDTGSTAYVYDAAGNVTQRTDAKGVVSTSTYDALNRRTATTYADGTLNVAYAYDEPNNVTGCPASSPVGRLTRLIETAVTTVYCYDAHGNVTRKSQTQGTVTDTTSYGYTLADRLASTLTPAGTSIQYTRDAAGRISGVTALPPGTSGAGAGNVVTAISYLPFGPIASYTLGNGQTVTRSYDANYAITDVVSPALNLHFARDAMGNITALGNASGASPATETYSYDPLYRLTGLYDASNTPEETYSYSKTGDRLSKTGNGLATGAYTYQTGTHHLTAIGNAARTYDANGNTTGSVIGGDTFGYGYNGRNRMTVVQRDGSTVGTYTYNALGQRTAKTSTFPTASSARFSYDEASQLLGEYGNSSRDYIWLGDLPVATIDTTSGVSTVSYVHADGLGTPRAVADASGNTIWQQAYKANAFGEQQPTSTNGFVYGLRFPGQYYDAESGLSDWGFRMYELATGRSPQSDPMGMFGGQSSTYAYAAGDPLQDIDPDGLQISGPRVPSSKSWRRPPGSGFGFGPPNGPVGPMSPGQTPGAWPSGSNPWDWFSGSGLTLVCMQGVCPTDTMACHVGMPTFRVLDFLGSYPSTAQFYSQNPGCMCTRSQWADLTAEAIPGPPPATFWDWLELATKVAERWR